MLSWQCIEIRKDFPGGNGKESTFQYRSYRDMVSIPGSGRSPGAEMATHSNILARTEEPGGLQSMRSQRVEHNWACTQDKKIR